MRQGSGKVVVHRNNIALLDKCLSKDILASTTLVSREQILLAHNILDSLLKADKRLRTCVSIVCVHHCSNLIVAHCIYATVCKHIEIYIESAETEGIKSTLLKCLHTALDRYKVELLHNANLVQLKRLITALIELYIAHNFVRFFKFERKDIKFYREKCSILALFAIIC